nr:replication-associated recombination protein A [bacterium]
LVGPGRLLRRAIEADRLTSSIFFGPPGCGKTTLANVIANVTGAAFERLNAVTSGVSDVRKIIEKAESNLKLNNRPTYLLLDECHRWNKAQSDSILPALENGVLRFIGSTTENPAIAMTPAIVSRCRLFRFEPLTPDQVGLAVDRAIADKERGYGMLRIQMEADARAHICSIANGDVRSALNALELAVLTTPAGEDGIIHITLDVAEESIQRRVLQMDESMFYDMLSAFCKSLRGSDSDAAISWAMRLLHAGADPRIIARRLIAHASEDIGLAAPDAMLQAVAAAQAVELIGLPEARLSLVQAIIFLCESPKSNAVVYALGSALEDVETKQNLPVPLHLQDASYSSHTRLGTGEGYKYPHDYPGHFIKQQYMPRGLEGKRYYLPSTQGFEARIRQLRAARGIIDPLSPADAKQMQDSKPAKPEDKKG